MAKNFIQLSRFSSEVDSQETKKLLAPLIPFRTNNRGNNGMQNRKDGDEAAR